MAKRLSVVISQGQSQNPAKRKLEESLVTGLLIEQGIDVTVVPHLYDLKPDGTGMLALQSISGNLVVLSWLFERASHWILDRNGIHGHIGEVELKRDPDDEEAENDDEVEADENQKERVLDSRSIPNRKIYCLDLRVANTAEKFIEEIKRIQAERTVQVVSLGFGEKNDTLPNGKSDRNPADQPPETINPTGTATDASPLDAVKMNADSLERFHQPSNSTSITLDGSQLEDSSATGSGSAEAILNRIEEQATRRWYPVIDYGRCTNCMECIDFCLFGVYGVDALDSILVEQPDNCRKGCPACSRVCPENAIIFPQHKTPAIAGSDEVGGSLKIDLSKLFGAPDDGKSPEEIAAIERDEQLIAAGREAVGMALPKRQTSAREQPKDDLDSLVDELDELDL